MSPEQLRGEPHLDVRSDLFSLAVVLYRALTGRYPFPADAVDILRNPGASAKPTPASSGVPELGPEVDAFFARALATAPADVGGALECFSQAIAIARQQQARSWELRAASSLARLLAAEGRRDEARRALADVYGWFTEGFDTADLREAKTLSEEVP